MNARRSLLRSFGALALVPWLPARAAEDVPDIPALKPMLGGRDVRWEKLKLTLPRLADNGFAVPMKLAMDGPFAPGPTVRTIHLFSETNPVPDMAAFEYPVPVERIEIDSRIRLAGTQHIVAVATMSDGTLYGAATEVVVTLAGCMDGT
ncbi:MAG TPA: thiosulfate oxidation carrier protein SoxY [Casimicrobiaceae bacterium]|nr:thiosulfate oxidation carrier protein SoxY [Casimicrobiaceae bacterium]